jgi:hypothetical protein
MPLFKQTLLLKPQIASRSRDERERLNVPFPTNVFLEGSVSGNRRAAWTARHAMHTAAEDARSTQLLRRCPY